VDHLKSSSVHNKINYELIINSETVSFRQAALGLLGSGSNAFQDLHHYTAYIECRVLRFWMDRWAENRLDCFMKYQADGII
jgi:hypothetical protein